MCRIPHGRDVRAGLVFFHFKIVSFIFLADSRHQLCEMYVRVRGAVQTRETVTRIQSYK